MSLAIGADDAELASNVDRRERAFKNASTVGGSESDGISEQAPAEVTPVRSASMRAVPHTAPTSLQSCRLGQVLLRHLQMSRCQCPSQ